MDPVPASIVTAIALSAAAGKNPWVPLGLLFLLAAPESVPSILMEEPLHAELHAMGPPGLLYGLGGVFVVVALLESLADKIAWVEQWLVPVSTAWRPFAAVAVASIVGFAAAGIPEEPTLAGISVDGVVTAQTSWWWAGSTVVTCILAGVVYGWIATIGKTGTRLLLSLVPLPSLRLAHSFLDDFFAVVASFAGFALSDSLLLAAAAALYLAVGIVFGPLLTRLTWIHFRVGWGLMRKAIRRVTDDSPAQPRPPRWVRRRLEADGLGLADAAVLPAYSPRAPGLGRFRAGWIVLARGEILFATRVLFRPHLLRWSESSLARVGLATMATSRTLTIVDRTEGGGLREIAFHLFPAYDDEILPLVEGGAARAGLARTRPHSESARQGLPGYAQRAGSVRYLPPERAGSLRGQCVVTIAVAIVVGVLTGGVLVPIGTGYAMSPFPRRFAVGILVSAYLALCVVATFGAAWPVTVLYAVILNTLALRDLTRTALKARIDGFVDRRAFLPPVAERVWVPENALRSPQDRWREADGVPVTDGAWKAVWSLLRDAPGGEPPRAAELGS